MAEVVVAASEVSSGKVTLEPGVVTTVRFEKAVGYVELLSDGAAEVYYAMDGSQPQAGGRNSYLMPAGALTVDRRATGLGDVVRMVATTAATVVVQRDDD